MLRKDPIPRLLVDDPKDDDWIQKRMRLDLLRLQLGFAETNERRKEIKAQISALEKEMEGL